MKQIGLAIMQYTQDFDEKYPITSADSLTSFATRTSGSSPFQLIYPYLKNRQVFVCPSAEPDTAAPPTATNATSYFLNMTVINFTGLSMAAINEPARRIVVQDFTLSRSTAYFRPYLNGSGKYVAWLRTGYSATHFDGGNLMFADGHAKWRKTTSICAADFGLNNVASAPLCGVETAGTADLDPAL